MKGFTLIEVIVAVVIFSIVMFAAFGLLDMARNSWVIGDVSVQLRQEIIKVFTAMEKDLKETRPSQISLGSGSSSSSLIFAIPADIDGDGTVLDSSGNIEWSSTITYATNGANQITRTDSGGTVIVANNISTLQFTRPVAPLNILQIDVTSQKTSVSGRQLQDAGQITIKMRN
jgi:prepilin-type N-terminal cleavage/methylation domain-containing protein